MRSVRERVLTSMAAAAGLALIFFGFASGKTDSGLIVLPEGIEAIAPSSGASVQRQTEILADLAPGYDGTLVVNGVSIPPDQENFDFGLSQVTFPCRVTQSDTTATTLPPALTATTVAGGSSGARLPNPRCIRGDAGAELIDVPQGTVSVTIIYWKIIEGRDASQRSFTWSFTTY